MNQQASAKELAGVVLSRMIVPLWILLGAGFKLWEGSPNNLPQNFVTFGRTLGINLDFMLYSLIGLELFAIGVMVLSARFARPMAAFMLSIFCIVLIGEMLRGEQACGCFGGGIDIKPWQMLLIDGALLAGIIFLRTRLPQNLVPLGKGLTVAAALLIGGQAISFGGKALLHQEQQQVVDEEEDAEPDDPTVNRSPRALPNWWYPEDLDAWVGKPWREAEVFQFMRRWPAGLDEGKHYVVFYSRTCGHCHEMFEFDLVAPLAAPVTAIQIPYNRNQLSGPSPLFDPADADPGIRHYALPLGTDWSMMTAPLTLRIEDGIITCAQEGEHSQCMQLLP